MQEDSQRATAARERRQAEEERGRQEQARAQAECDRKEQFYAGLAAQPSPDSLHRLIRAGMPPDEKRAGETNLSVNVPPTPAGESLDSTIKSQESLERAAQRKAKAGEEQRRAAQAKSGPKPEQWTKWDETAKTLGREHGYGSKLGPLASITINDKVYAVDGGKAYPTKDEPIHSPAELDAWRQRTEAASKHPVDPKWYEQRQTEMWRAYYNEDPAKRNIVLHIQSSDKPDPEATRRVQYILSATTSFRNMSIKEMESKNVSESAIEQESQHEYVRDRKEQFELFTGQPRENLVAEPKDLHFKFWDLDVKLTQWTTANGDVVYSLGQGWAYHQSTGGAITKSEKDLEYVESETKWFRNSAEVQKHFDNLSGLVEVGHAIFYAAGLRLILGAANKLLEVAPRVGGKAGGKLMDAQGLKAPEGAPVRPSAPRALELTGQGEQVTETEIVNPNRSVAGRSIAWGSGPGGNVPGEGLSPGGTGKGIPAGEPGPGALPASNPRLLTGPGDVVPQTLGGPPARSGGMANPLFAESPTHARRHLPARRDAPKKSSDLPSARPLPAALLGSGT
jgi:hypothetical protein